MSGITLTTTEQHFLQKSKRKITYEGESIPIIECNTIHEMGKLTALRFIEWVHENPTGVIALPTGKTPEYFIHFLKHYKNTWGTPNTKKEIKEITGLELDNFPDTSQLHFVQLDEFYPIDPSHSRSFTNYIKQYYLPLLNLKEENLHMIDVCFTGTLKEHGIKKVFPDGKVDTTLLQREPRNELERLQKKALDEMEEFCKKFEQKIRDLGGVGFFLGGIGADGHIAFNLRGSPMDSKTRLVTLNYETAAQVSGDLGGIQYSRDKSAITMGLETITFKKDVVLIIMAAGEAKSRMIADAVLSPKRDPQYPATALIGVPNARMYITRGAAIRLPQRKAEDLEREMKEHQILEAVMNISFKTKKPLKDLTEEDFKNDPSGRVLLKKFKVEDVIQRARDHIIASLDRGLNLAKDQTFLHTGPHHDDVMLSYYPVVKELFKRNKQHFFAFATSGFVSVTNQYIVMLLEKMDDKFLKDHEKDILSADLDDLIGAFVDAYKKNDTDSMQNVERIILCHAIQDVWKEKSLDKIKEKIDFLYKEYFPNQLPGQQDHPDVETLKGFMRETEEDRIWRIHGFHLDVIYHLRTKFYTGDYFKPLPTIEGDAVPVYELIKKTKPSIITLAFDPVGTGPDTHYRVLQVIGEALRMYEENERPMVWGYRNVWYRFHPSFCNIMAPVCEERFKELNDDFLACFSTQKYAEFPSPDHDGPFSELAEKIQREQLDQLRCLLGDEFIDNHPNESVRKAAGFLFLKEMTTEEFLEHSLSLKKELISN